jgi:glyoxylase-like metal-dependent hydrolase (beta-lactamase superfamily II)
MISRLLALMMIAILAICPSAMAQQRKAERPASVRLYVFDCGKLDIPDITNYQLKREEIATSVMAVPCYLVAHPKGTLMWDVGAVPDSAFTAGSGKLHFATATKTLGSQLAEIGYSPGDITYQAFSHFHWDHVANANVFAGATWLARKLDYDVMFGDSPSAKLARARPRSDPSVYSALKNSKTVMIGDSDHDVFGDGTVVLKLAPGHSPGHQVLFVNLAKTGPVVLGGDLYHYPEERTLKRVPTTEFNIQQTTDARAAIEAFVEKTRAQLWIQHDFTADAKLKKSPAFYD